ncbi:hypothetical protein [Bernardetia sp.]|uniref:hypothetical protein n=1 Tax=Bernardetia sp. TaxID=1937974 RepID=UPI0025C5CAFE|nr:hypothetical protein [Bernardetia sp.]
MNSVVIGVLTIVRVFIVLRLKTGVGFAPTELIKIPISINYLWNALTGLFVSLFRGKPLVEIGVRE